MTGQDFIPMLNLTRLHAPIAKALKEAFASALATGQFIGGSAVERFEKELAEYIGVSHAIGVSSGTDALLVSLMALGVKPGDEVITTTYTFYATAGAISRLGAIPVFIDIEPESYNIYPQKISEAITDRTVGIIPVHLFGRCAEMSPILNIAKSNNLWVLEDAAQAIGATYQNSPAGTMGNVGTFSFFPAKNLGALGDAGAVVTNETELAERIVALRQGGGQKVFHTVVGGNFRLDAIQASFLSVKLPHLETWEEGRHQIAARYEDLLGGIDGVTLPRVSNRFKHVFNQYVIRVEKRDLVLNALKAAGIGCAVYYPEPLHRQSCFKALCRYQGDLTKSEKASRQTLAIPIDPLLDRESQERIASVICNQLNG